jgi:predicted HAD superfamily hydrolase
MDLTEAVPQLVEESFLTALMIVADQQDVVSLDMFDTMVTRRLTSPADVFAEVEKRLVSQYGAKNKGFAKERETVELALYSERGDIGREDVSHAMIYDKLKKYPEEARFIERDVELDVLVASKDMLRFARQLNQLNKPWIVVSDMYLPKEFLETALAKCGFAGWRDVYVSCEFNATKHSGSIWKHVAQKYNIKKMLHVGDNAHSDMSVPSGLGITTLPYPRLATYNHTGAALTPDLLPYSYLNRYVELNMPEEVTDDDRWTALGASMGSIFISAFLLWIVERVKATGIKRIYFCARDGHLLHRAWNSTAFPRTMPSLEVRYLNVSRAPLQLARGYEESNPNWLSPQLVDFLIMVDKKTTPDTILNRITDNPTGYLVDDLRKEFPTIILDRPYETAMASLRVILGRHSEYIYNCIRPIAEHTKAYLLQEGLGDDIKSAIVDTGWHANQQRCLSTIVGKQVGGLYIGLWRRALGALPKAGFAEGAYASPFHYQDKEEVSELMQSVNILESLLTSPEGSTVDYKQDARARWIPVTRVNELEYMQYCAKVKWFQQGVINVVDQIFNGYSYGPLSLDDCTIEAGRAALNYVCMGPTESQLDLIGQLDHAFLSDHENTDCLVSNEFPAGDETAHRILSEKGWVMGVLLNWYRMAPVSKKSWIRTLVKERLSNLSERRLRPFWK